MGISGKERIYEENRLKDSYNKLIKRISELEIELKESFRSYKKSNEQMWEFGKSSIVDSSDLIENMPYLDSIKSDYYRIAAVNKELQRMLLLKKDMYFGRIDFKEESDEEDEKIYIGKFSFADDTGEYLVYDWRASICSLFYENELGEVSYQAPGGRIRGNMSKKRQFEIFHDEINAMFDSSVMIDDSILKEILSKSKDSKMSNIVETIQKEQNIAIRSEYDTIIVEGPAGCGKTSIAMHRAAWLMYKYKNELRNNQIIVFSPNETFNDYISDVLPELGEENIAMSTFQSLAYNILSNKHFIVTKYTELEDVLTDGTMTNMQDISIKYSIDFAHKLEVYVNDIAKGNYSFTDFKVMDETIVDAATLERLFYQDFEHSDVITRMARMRVYLMQAVHPIIRRLREEYVDSVKSNAIDMSLGFVALREKSKLIYSDIEKIVSTDFNIMYSSFLEDNYGKEVSDRFTDRLEEGYLNYEDVPALIYLRLLLGEQYVLNNIRHVIIDEFQDYSYLERKIISIIFKKCHMTVLGDKNQKIYHYIEDYNSEDILRNAKRIRLNKSYRSTYQIASFANQLLDSSLEIEYFNRQGNEPLIENINTEDLDEIAKSINSGVTRLKQMGHKSIAVITRTNEFSKKLYPYIQQPNLQRVNESTTKFTKGVVLMPAYLSKGLEFDAVIVIDTANDSFDKQKELNLYYTSCTRALHELHIIR